MRRPLLATLCWLALVPVTGAASNTQPDQDTLKRLTLEELMRVDVSLTSRRAEPLDTTAAAVSVVTTSDIRRSGVTTLGDAVSLATGVHVARMNTGTWSISARGFNSTTANKMLVMVDGRTVYSPLFSGTFWNAIDYVLEDVDRIEVIRGAGAALWGANAVNGIVNIVTRSAASTQGLHAQFGGGNEDLIAETRYGWTRGSSAYRLYAKYAGRDSQVFSDGSDAGDRRDRGQAGFRLDRGDAGAASLLLKADAFFSKDSLPDRPHANFFTGDIQARVTKALSAASQLQIQGYVNHERRRVPLQLEHRLTTLDIDAQHTLTQSRHHLVWGTGARLNHDRITPSQVLSFDPAAKSYAVYNAFVQDEFALVPALVSIIPGVRMERNAFSGFEWQPGIRARMLLPEGQTLWGSVARAVRRPTRFDEDIRASLPNGLLVAQGNPDFESERLVAAEVGYRLQPLTYLSLDATVFHHSFDRLRSQEAPATGPPVPITVGNTLNGTSTGVEVAVIAQPAAWTRIQFGYVGQDVSITRDPDSRDVGGGITEANDPEHQLSLRGSVDVGQSIELDVRLRHVSTLPDPRVPSYSELFARISWTPRPGITLALTGDDLLHDQHPEFNPTARGFEELERSVRATVTIRAR